MIIAAIAVMNKMNVIVIFSINFKESVNSVIRFLNIRIDIIIANTALIDNVIKVDANIIAEIIIANVSMFVMFRIRNI